MLKINKLNAKINSKEILKGLSLEINPGEVHAIMGPNGSGKSTLANIIMGNPAYEIIKGDILFEGKSIIKLGHGVIRFICAELCQSCRSSSD